MGDLAGRTPQELARELGVPCPSEEDVTLLHQWHVFQAGCEALTARLLADVEERAGVAPSSLKVLWFLLRAPERTARMQQLAQTLGFSTAGTTKVAELVSLDEPRRRLAAEMSGLDIQYDLGEGHPLLGRRMPDLDLLTAQGAVRVFALLHEARAVLLNLGTPPACDVSPWADRVSVMDAEYRGDWELPVVGKVAAPAAVLIRPDGYVAWADDAADPA